jgi:uncharacterized pyridoxamine 5'-phosphate oxidase family protein
MDIVKITMFGYGCEIGRGTVNNKDYKKLKELTNNVWHKNLIKKIKEDTDIEIKIISEDYGIIKGDIKIEVDGNVILDSEILTLDVLNENIITKEIVDYPNTDDILVTTVQHMEGIICDMLLVIDDKFDLNKLKIVRKDIMYNVDNPSVSSLYCELYYDGEKIILTDSTTDLRNSRLYLEKVK